MYWICSRVIGSHTEGIKVPRVLIRSTTEMEEHREYIKVQELMAKGRDKHQGMVWNNCILTIIF